MGRTEACGEISWHSSAISSTCSRSRFTLCIYIDSDLHSVRETRMFLTPGFHGGRLHMSWNNLFVDLHINIVDTILLSFQVGFIPIN